jgi:tRNA1(Val) A37 N6-methylase TrmN6
MANPPYLAAASASAPPDAGKAAANVEGEARLSDWVRFCLTMTRPKGTVVFIHRADRIDALLAELSGRAGEIAVFPLWPAADRPASRIVVRARKGVAAPTRLLRGLVLHEADGRYTPQAEAVLRSGLPLEF